MPYGGTYHSAFVTYGTPPKRVRAGTGRREWIVKYSFMSFSTPELSFDEMLRTAGDLGYDGIEPRVVAGHAHGVELEADAAARMAMRERAAEQGIAIACVATSCSYADPERTQQMVDDTRRYVDLAADIGAPCIRVFGGRIPEGIPREQAVDHVAKALEEVAPHAEGRGVSICLETHDDWCDPAHVAEVMRKVDRDGVAVNWDIMHPIRAGNSTMDRAFEALGPWIKHTHLHDGNDEGKLVPIGEGIIDHRRAVELLAGADFEGHLSGEWIKWEPWETHLPRELATLKRYEADVR